MATVPGKPDDNLDFLHPALKPTPADFLQAASIMKRQLPEVRVQGRSPAGVKKESDQ